MAVPRVQLLVLLAMAVALAAGCNNTLYDAQGIPPLGALVCSVPETHACHEIRACMRDDDVLHCEADCHACTTDVADARPVCVANTCRYECPAGLLKCETGCCAAAKIAAGGDHACAITEGTGELLCWGANNDGQLGIGYDPASGGNSEAGTHRSMPVKVALPGRVVSVGAGGAHSCAVLQTGAVWCWGRRSSYAGGKDYDFVPVAAPGMVGATAVASGGAHSCAIVAGGAVQCLGTWNPLGEVKGEPVSAGAIALAAGDDFTCAIVERAPGAGMGSVQCWGANDHAQLGGGASGAIVQPVTVPLAAPVTTIGVGVHHACASDAAGPLRCWSARRVGVSPDPDPYRPDGAHFGASAITGGQAHTCAVRADTRDGVECWGSRPVDVPFPSAGPFDVVVGGSAAGPGAPVHVSVAAPVSALAAGDFHTCAIDGTGRVACWGLGGRGQLGDGRLSDSAAPAYVISH